jgi:hypothetical protein
MRKMRPLPVRCAWRRGSKVVAWYSRETGVGAVEIGGKVCAALSRILTVSLRGIPVEEARKLRVCAPEEGVRVR